jgi:hypothetical protein
LTQRDDGPGTQTASEPAKYPPLRSVLCLAGSVGLCAAIVAWHVTTEDRLAPTLLFLGLVATGGFVLTMRLSRRLADVRLEYLAYIYLGKLPLLLLVLYAGWVPTLDPRSADFGYDAQRFYLDAATLAERGFDPEAARLANVNYTGILYYYGGMFALLGHNPALPALTNAFTTLLAALLLVYVGYLVQPQRGSGDWVLGLGMILPEVVWFDALTARDSIAMSLAVIGSLALGLSVVRPAAFRLWQPLCGLLAVALLGVIRTSMLVPVVGGLGLLFYVSSLTTRQRLAGLGVLGLICLAAPTISRKLGAYPLDYATLLKSALLKDDAFFQSVTWSSRSVGRLLVPADRFEAFLLFPPRLVLYLVAPLPPLRFSLTELLQGQWSAWQNLCLSASSVIYIALFPRAVASLIQVFRRNAPQDALVLHIPCWSLLVAVALGNQIIHERYRLVAALLLWGCMWLGRRSPRRLLLRVYLAWFGLLVLGGILYGAYKVIA